jgi:hypothetical protein
VDRIFVEEINCGPHILFQRNIDLEFSCMQVYRRYCCPIACNIDEITIRISRTAISFESSEGPDRYIVIYPFLKQNRKYYLHVSYTCATYCKSRTCLQDNTQEGCLETCTKAFSPFMHKYVQLYPNISMCRGKTLDGVRRIKY